MRQQNLGLSGVGFVGFRAQNFVKGVQVGSFRIDTGYLAGSGGECT